MSEILIPHTERDGAIHDYVPGQPIPTLLRDPRTGEVYVNELKRYVKPFTLVTDPVSITLAGDATSDLIPMVIDNKGHFEIFQAFFVSQRSEGFTVELFETEDRPFLMNREVHVRTIASGGGVTTKFGGTFGAVGSAGRPFRWPESLWMGAEEGEGSKAIFARFRNLSGSENTIRFNLHGLRWYHTVAPPKVADRMKAIYHGRFRSMPYFYTTEGFVRLSASGTDTAFTRFTDEAWTEWVKGMSISTGRYNVRILETASTKRFMEQAIRDDIAFGNGEFPFLLWESSLFEPDYQLSFEVADLSGLENDIWITLACRKIFWDPKEGRLGRP